jgi:hypothetical protein
MDFSAKLEGQKEFDAGIKGYIARLKKPKKAYDRVAKILRDDNMKSFREGKIDGTRMEDMVPGFKMVNREASPSREDIIKYNEVKRRMIPRSAGGSPILEKREDMAAKEFKIMTMPEPGLSVTDKGIEFGTQFESKAQRFKTYDFQKVGENRQTLRSDNQGTREDSVIKRFPTMVSENQKKKMMGEMEKFVFKDALENK